MKTICLINTRNHASFIDECVRSCLGQTVPSGCQYAVHVVDAGSTDGTVQALRAYGDQITLHERDNVGQSGAFDLCLALDAESFMFCDGDDRLQLNRLQRVMEVLDTHADVVLVGNSIREVDEKGSLIREVYVGQDRYLDARKQPDAGQLYEARSLMGTSRLAVRKTALAKILPFETVILFEADELLFSLLPALGRVCILSERLTDYRLHGKNNYQRTHTSAVDVGRYRFVHEAIRSCMRTICDRLDLAGPYLLLCQLDLQMRCEKVKVLEDALLSREAALKVVMGDPEVLGLVSPPLAKRIAFSLPVLMLGLRRSLLILERVRRLGPPKRFESARLL